MLVSSPIRCFQWFLTFWVQFFILASVPSCMPIYTGLQRWILCSLAISRSAVRTMSTVVSDPGPVFSISYVTAPNDTIAKFIARGLLERKLAGCVNVIPGVTSIYTWKNETQEDSEVMMIIKSKISVLEEMTKFIRENHPYDVCEVISTPITQGNPPYMQWLQEVVPDPTMAGENAKSVVNKRDK